MNERPDHPSQKSACAQPSPLQHRVILADYGHVALVEIAEWTFDAPPLQLFRDQPPDEPPFLNRRLRHAGHRMFTAFALHDRCRVADHEHFGRFDDPQERVDERSPCAGCFGAEHLWNWRRRNTPPATPAVHSTGALGIRIPPATTPNSSTVSTLTPVCTFTPSLVSRRVTLRDSGSTKVGRTRLAASSRMMALLDGSMRRKFPLRVTLTICAKDAAS